MSIETAMMEQRIRDMESRVHTFCSVAGNALERIAILIDEDELDEARSEIAQLRETLAGVSGS